MIATNAAGGTTTRGLTTRMTAGAAETTRIVRIATDVTDAMTVNAAVHAPSRPGVIARGTRAEMTTGVAVMTALVVMGAASVVAIGTNDLATTRPGEIERSAAEAITRVIAATLVLTTVETAVMEG